MVKRLLSLVTVLVAFCCLANAQQFKRNGLVLPLKYKNVMKNAPATRASSEGEAFSYSQSNSVTTVGAGTNHYDCAIYVPGSFAGNKIDLVAFYIADKSVVSNVECWVATTLPNSIPGNCDYSADVTVNDDLLTTGRPCVIEGVNYTVPQNGCYVGYSFDITNTQSQYGAYPIAFDGVADIEGGAYLKYSGSSWQNMKGQGFGNLITVVQMSGDNFMGDAVQLNDIEFKANVVKDGTSNVRLSVMNYGLTDISSLSYTVKDVKTGNLSYEKTVQFDTPIAFCQLSGVTFSLDAGNELGIFNKELTITKVNGKSNEYSDGAVTAEGSLLVVSRDVVRKVVVEEFTGTGCQNCPRGYAGMAALADKYPDEFIGISPHVGVNYEDTMETSAYDDVLRLFPQGIGVPSAFLNRMGNMKIYDPYVGSSSSTALGILDDFEAARGAAEAEVSVNPQWNEDQTKINVSTDVTFLYSRDDAPYALAYVLLSDGLQGSDYPWWQYNGYSNKYQGNVAIGEPYLDAWLTKGEIDNVYIQGYGNLQGVFVKDMVYDHVALATENIVPTKATLKSPIVAEEKQSGTMTFDVSNGIKGYYLGNELIQDKSNLKVVAMLINTETGEIVNADESEIAAYDPTGIENVTATGEEAVEVARYALDGTQLSVPTKGVNIVKMSDGTTKKVIVK